MFPFLFMGVASQVLYTLSTPSIQEDTSFVEKFFLWEKEHSPDLIKNISIPGFFMAGILFFPTISQAAETLKVIPFSGKTSNPIINTFIVLDMFKAYGQKSMLVVPPSPVLPRLPLVLAIEGAKITLPANFFIPAFTPLLLKNRNPQFSKTFDGTLKVISVVGGFLFFRNQLEQNHPLEQKDESMRTWLEFFTEKSHKSVHWVQKNPIKTGSIVLVIVGGISVLKLLLEKEAKIMILESLVKQCDTTLKLCDTQFIKVLKLYHDCKTDIGLQQEVILRLKSKLRK